MSRSSSSRANCGVAGLVMVGLLGARVVVGVLAAGPPAGWAGARPTGAWVSDAIVNSSRGLAVDQLGGAERAGSHVAAAADGAVLTEAQGASLGVGVDDLLLPRDGEPVGALVAGGVLGELVAGHEI